MTKIHRNVRTQKSYGVELVTVIGGVIGEWPIYHNIPKYNRGSVVNCSFDRKILELSHFLPWTNFYMSKYWEAHSYSSFPLGSFRLFKKIGFNQLIGSFTNGNTMTHTYACA